MMGNIYKLPSTKPLLHTAKNANVQFKEALEGKKKAEKEEREKLCKYLLIHFLKSKEVKILPA